MAGTLTLRLRGLRWEAEGVFALELEAADGGALPRFDPGAHIDLLLPGLPPRQYSLCGDPADAARWRIGVRAVAGGRVSQLIHRALRPGALLEASTPRNNFPLLPSANYLFIAGGIGITPLLPMLREVGPSGTLLFCAKTAADAPFLAEARATGGTVEVFASSEGQRLDIAQRLAAVPAETRLYCCGPERLMLAVEQAAAYWPQDRVHFEWFAARSRPEDEGSESFDLVCAQRGLTLSVAAGTSVLHALRGAGIDLPSSCEQGVCGTCECRVLEGDIDHRDSILSAAERAEGAVMMACVSRARGKRLVLDL